MSRILHPGSSEMYITQNSKHRTISPIEQKIAELCEARDAAGRDHPCYYEACAIA
jgi:hypothetical protein